MRLGYRTCFHTLYDEKKKKKKKNCSTASCHSLFFCLIWSRILIRLSWAGIEIFVSFTLFPQIAVNVGKGTNFIFLIVFQKWCHLYVSMETMKDTGNAITPFDRATFQQQNTFFFIVTILGYTRWSAINKGLHTTLVK